MSDEVRGRRSIVDGKKAARAGGEGLPKIFVGSSAEGLDAARAVQSLFEHDAQVKLWSNFFRPSEGFLMELLRAVHSYDFAVFLMTPDDTVKLRGRKLSAARDNVIFELGMFYGGLGRHRTFFVRPRRTEFRLPSDLEGIKGLDYDERKDDWKDKLGAACNDIRESIQALGTRELHIDPETERAIPANFAGDQ